MRRQLPGTDGGLAFRMFLVMFLLAAVYLFFLAVLWSSGVNWITMAIMAAIMLGIQYFFSDKLVLLSMGAKEVSAAEEPWLHATIERLCAVTGIPKPKIAVAKTDLPNAFATGRDPAHAVVCVTTGIMRRLDRAELEAVLGHELTHVKNRDVSVITFASFFATIASFIMQWGMWMGMGYGGRRNERGNSFILVYLVSLLVWVISFLLIRALSRYRELAADRGGAIMTGAPSTLSSALVKISSGIQRIPQQDLRNVEALNAFFVVPAISGESVAQLFSTHPSLKQRLEQLERLQREMER